MGEFFHRAFGEGKLTAFDIKKDMQENWNETSTRKQRIATFKDLIKLF